MPRKKIIPVLTDKDRFDDHVIEAIKNTSIEMREQIAFDFSYGQLPNWFDGVCRMAKCTRDALLIAALVDAESRLVFTGQKLKAKTMIALVDVVSKLPQYDIIKNYPQIAHSTVDNLTQTVDKSAKPVDRNVEKSPIVVDMMLTDSGDSHLSTVGVDNLSTGCGEVAELSTVLSTGQ